MDMTIQFCIGVFQVTFHVGLVFIILFLRRNTHVLILYDELAVCEYTCGVVWA